MKVYETVIFMQGDDADEAFEISGMIEDGYIVKDYADTRDALYDHLMQWEYGESTGDESDTPPWGGDDRVCGYAECGAGGYGACGLDEADYVLTFHTGLTSCSLVRVTVRAADHSHECRDCKSEIECDDPCTWQGGNDKCSCE